MHRAGIVPAGAGRFGAAAGVVVGLRAGVGLPLGVTRAVDVAHRAHPVDCEQGSRPRPPDVGCDVIVKDPSILLDKPFTIMT